MTPTDREQQHATVMRAALYDGYGPPSVLYEGEVPIPRNKPDEIMVRVHALTVNGGELVSRSGRFRLVSPRRFPKRLGMDFVGDVVDVGSAVTGVRNGELVWGVLPRSAAVSGRAGSAAEYVVADPSRVARAPSTVSPAEAASILGGGATSITALRDKARLAPGERLLVRGASGGVGSVAVQLGKAFGAHVTGLAGRANLDFVRSLGADEVFDYRTATLSDLGNFDVIMDTAGTEHAAFRRLLTPGGRMVAIAFDASRFRTAGYFLASTVYGSRRVRFFSGNAKHDLIAEVTQLVEDGKIRPVVDTVYPLSDLAAAHAALEAGGVRGKYVVAPTPAPPI